uniref:Uncharacterized protein n=1 Tax=Siphoviridae sp. ctB3v5 TaxID=2826186 RepID=A0A8S5M9V7_9CAUD|nr:MAG TPA: hypothetical protein [Siphoviridae sp. ctB3v5]
MTFFILALMVFPPGRSRTTSTLSYVALILSGTSPIYA